MHNAECATEAQPLEGEAMALTDIVLSLEWLVGDQYLQWREAFLGTWHMVGASGQDLVDYIDFLVSVVFGPMEPPGTTGWYSSAWSSP